MIVLNFRQHTTMQPDGSLQNQTKDEINTHLTGLSAARILEFWSILSAYVVWNRPDVLYEGGDKKSGHLQREKLIESEESSFNLA